MNPNWAQVSTPGESVLYMSFKKNKKTKHKIGIEKVMLKNHYLIINVLNDTLISIMMG